MGHDEICTKINLISAVCGRKFTNFWLCRRPHPPNNGTPNMVAANFVVITNGEECALNGTAVAAVFIDQ